LLKAEPFLCEAVNIGCLRILISKAGKIRPSHIVNENKDDVGPFFARSTKTTEQQPQQKEGSEPMEKAHLTEACWKRMKIAQK
jgi:hypothetical protein